MFKSIINGVSTSEIYKIDAVDMKRGAVLTKNYTTKIAAKASGVGKEIYFLDYNSVPTGHQSDMEISGYDTTMDTVKASTYGVVKHLVSGTWATDQVDATGLAAGDYLIAGTTTNVGKLIKAVATNIVTLRYVGIYDDAGHTLYAFEIIPEHTVA